MAIEQATGVLEARIRLIEGQLEDAESKNRILSVRVRQLEAAERQLDLIRPELERLKGAESNQARASLYGKLLENSRRQPMLFLEEAAKALAEYFGCEGAGFYKKQAIINEEKSDRINKLIRAYWRVKGDAKQETSQAARIRLFAERYVRENINPQTDLRNFNPGEYMNGVGVLVPLFLHPTLDQTPPPALYFKGTPGENSAAAFSRDPIQINANPWSIRNNMKKGILRRRKIRQVYADINNMFNYEAEMQPDPQAFREKYNNDPMVWIERQHYPNSIIWTDEEGNEKDEIIADVVCYGFRGKDPLQLVSPEELRFRTDTIDRFVAPVLSSLLLTEHYKAYMELAKSAVSKKVARIILRNPKILNGAPTYAAIVMPDIKGFTKKMEELGEEVNLILWARNFWSAIDPIFNSPQDGGFISSHGGDDVTAVYTELFAGKDYRLLAVKAALHAQDALVDYARTVGDDFRFNLGINGGRVWVGNYASKEKIEFSAMGDPVNRTARLQVACKEDREEFAHMGEPLAAIAQFVYEGIQNIERELEVEKRGLVLIPRPARLVQGKQDLTPPYLLVLKKK